MAIVSVAAVAGVANQNGDHSEIGLVTHRRPDANLNRDGRVGERAKPSVSPAPWELSRNVRHAAAPAYAGG
jgi:hypothetical protein